MSNSIGTLRSPKGTTKNKRRIGRGQGSGRGGTSTRGHKGHRARSGFGQIPNFEGGQMAYIRRVPKFGFHSPFRVEYQAVNVSRLQELAEAGKLADGAVTPESLFALGVISKRSQPLKILGNGEISTKLTVTAHKISAAARTKIEQAGGTVTLHE
jgi:large subunit ribosomal protein L15